MAEIGQILNGRYRLVELLGEGGMATIFRATDTELRRDVAVKVMRAEYGRDAGFVARFRQEAQAAARLSHPNIATVYDYGTDGDAPFIVMELVEGGDLAAVIRERGALPVGAAARIAGQIADALEAAHARGIIHRDVKPSNVLLGPDGRVKVVDFGIARALSEAQLTLPGTTLGSVHYFSPEQARGEVVTARSDVYSLGLVLWEMLTGRRAWSGDSAAAVAVARLSSDPPPPSALRPDVPAAMDAIVGKALAREPADRFASAAEMASALERFLRDPYGPPFPGAFPDAGRTVVDPPQMALQTAPPPPPPMILPPQPDYGIADDWGQGPLVPYEEPLPPSRPWGWIAALLALLVLLVGGVLLFLLLTGGRNNPSATPSPSAAVVTVPTFVDLTFAQAQQLAQQRGVIVTIVATVQRSDVPENTVISQDPVSGALIPATQPVKLTVSTSKATISVPDLRGRTESNAQAAIVDAQLVVGRRSESFDAQVPASIVIGGVIAAGVQVAPGTAIDYIVSLGPTPTPAPTPPPTPSPSPSPSASPSPSESPTESASPSPTESPSPSPSPSPTATPTDTPPPTPTPTAPPTPTPTAPPTDTPSPPPTPSPSPSPVPVGEYRCQDVATARAAITVAGLVVGTITPAPPTSDDTWLVLDQDPQPGQPAVLGSAVNLTVYQPVDPCVTPTPSPSPSPT